MNKNSRLFFIFLKYYNKVRKYEYFGSYLNKKCIKIKICKKHSHIMSKNLEKTLKKCYYKMNSFIRRNSDERMGF